MCINNFVVAAIMSHLNNLSLFMPKMVTISSIYLFNLNLFMNTRKRPPIQSPKTIKPPTVKRSPKAKKRKAKAPLTETQKLMHALKNAKDAFERSEAIDDIHAFIKNNKKAGVFDLTSYSLTDDESGLLTKALVFRLGMIELDKDYKHITILPVIIHDTAAQQYNEKQKEMAALADAELLARQTPREVKEDIEQPSLDSLLTAKENPKAIAKKLYERIEAIKELNILNGGDFICLTFPHKSNSEIDEVKVAFKKLGIKLNDFMTLDEGQLAHAIENLQKPKLPPSFKSTTAALDQRWKEVEARKEARKKQVQQELLESQLEYTRIRARDAEEMATNAKKHEEDLQEWRQWQEYKEQRQNALLLKDEKIERDAQKIEEKRAADQLKANKRNSLVLSVPLSPINVQVARWEQRQDHTRRVIDAKEALETARSKRLSDCNTPMDADSVARIEAVADRVSKRVFTFGQQ